MLRHKKGKTSCQEIKPNMPKFQREEMRFVFVFHHNSFCQKDAWINKNQKSLVKPKFTFEDRLLIKGVKQRRSLHCPLNCSMFNLLTMKFRFSFNEGLASLF